MAWNGFVGVSRVRARARYIGERLDLRGLETPQRLGVGPLVVRAGANGCAVLFRYGVAVFFNVTLDEEAAFLGGLQAFLVGPMGRIETEELDLVVDPDKHEGVDNDVITVQNAGVERLQLVADVLAKSAVLSHYEVSIAEIFDSVEPLAASLQGRALSSFRSGELLRHVGATLLIHHKMVGRVEVREKPDVLWNHPELERLFLRLEDEFEIVERHTALERKVELIARTAETLIALMRHRSTLRVEWYIVVLIVVEIVLTLSGSFH